MKIDLVPIFIWGQKFGGCMKVLIACEFSGRVRDAFIKRGHDAISCDLLPTEQLGPHYQGDVFDIIDDGWDLMIAFPPCTHLCSSGAPHWKEKQKDGRQQQAINFFIRLYKSNVLSVCCENPSGILSTVWRKPDQYIHPYQFGEPFRKRTGLWLKNLPLLKPTNIINPVANWHDGSTRGGLKKDGTRTPSKFPTAIKIGMCERGTNKNRWKIRSVTFQGVADAMAEQWGK